MDSDNETSGVAKGSLKDRLRVLNILMRISRKKKLRLQFSNINAKRILHIKKITQFFYMPVIYVFNPKLKVNSLDLYDGTICPIKYSLKKEKKSFEKRELELIQVRKFRKGIGPLEEILKNNNETHTFPIVDGLPEKTSVINYIESNALEQDLVLEYSKIYNVSEQDLNMDLVYNILILRCCSEVVFERTLLIEEIKDFIDAQIEDKNIVEDVFKFDENEIKLTGNDELKPRTDMNIQISHEKLQYLEQKIRNSEQWLKKLNHDVSDQSSNFDYILEHIDEYNTKTTTNYQLKGLNHFFNNFLSLGLGILTLPFSRIGGFTLGSSLINRSVKQMRSAIHYEQKDRTINNYTITSSDIDRCSSCIRTSSFLLNDTLKEIKELKTKIELHKYEITDSQKLIKRIELVEKGLTVKKIKIEAIEQKLEKSKTKILERKVS